ncbi:MAG: hypothetical protein ACLSVD_02435 [Eggerthellaceae bacterium]
MAIARRHRKTRRDVHRPVRHRTPVTLSIGGVELRSKIASYQSAYRQADKALPCESRRQNRFVIGSYQAE